VTLIHRRDTLRAEKILQERLFKHPKIETLWHQALDEVLGEGTPPGVTGVRLRDLRDGSERIVPCSGVFVAIGHAPASQLVEGQLPTHSGGYVVTRPGSTATDIPGVFAAGDIADPIFRQAITSAGMGCMAALEAERFLAAEEFAGAARAAE
jgi:thioredoxin reductase (NADPH)